MRYLSQKGETKELVKFRVLKGADRRVALEGRRTVLPPVPTPKQSTWIKKSHGGKPIAIKDHKTHEIYPTDKARASRLINRDG